MLYPIPLSREADLDLYGSAGDPLELTRKYLVSFMGEGCVCEAQTPAFGGQCPHCIILIHKSPFDFMEDRELYSAGAGAGAS